MGKILIKLSNLIFKYNKILVGIWLCSVIFCLWVIINIKTPVLESELSGASNTEAHKVEQILRKNFSFNPESSQAFVIEGKDQDFSLKNKLIKSFPQILSIEEITSQKEKNTSLFYVQFKEYFLPREAQALVKDIREVIREWEKEKGLKAYLTGDSAFFYDISESGKNDSSKNEKIALVFAFFILIYIFGGLLSAFLPLLTGATTILYLNTLIILFNIPVNSISQVLNSMIGLGLAIDYSLFMVSRFSEEIESNDTGISLKRTLENSGKTILFSALIMLCSVLVLKIPDVSSSKAIVDTISIVILISCFNSMIFLPAFLVMGKNYLSKPEFLTNKIKQTNKYLFWKKFSTHVVNHYKKYFILSFLMLILMAIPVFSMKLWEPLQTMTPKDSESRIGYEILEKDGWGGELIPVNVVIKSKNGESLLTDKGISFIYDYTKHMEKNSKINSVLSLVTIAPNIDKNTYIAYYTSFYGFQNLFGFGDFSKIINKTGDITLIGLYQKKLMNIQDTYEIINYSREYSKNHQEFEILTGGIVARSRDFTKELYSHNPAILSIIFVSIFLLLYFYMKTPVLPIKAGIMNFLPIISAFGILTLIFQYGFMSKILDTPVNNAVTTMVPITLFCVTFGLSMDYEVLILSRITEIYRETGDVKQAVVDGLAKSGSVISGAALILLAVFVPGIFSSSSIVKEMCIGIASAILIDATLVRLFLVPSFMLLLGKWNWWNPFKK